MALNGNILVCRIGGSLWGVVAYESWSHLDVLLYQRGINYCIKFLNVPENICTVIIF